MKVYIVLLKEDSPNAKWRHMDGVIDVFVKQRDAALERDDWERNGYHARVVPCELPSAAELIAAEEAKRK